MHEAPDGRDTMLRNAHRLAKPVSPRLRKVVERAQTKLPFPILVVQGHRPQSEQDRLWKIGRTLPGAKVTWVRVSNHTHGEAVDLSPYPYRTRFDADFKLLVDAMLEAGGELDTPIRWLGKKDAYHFELA